MDIKFDFEALSYKVFFVIKLILLRGWLHGSPKRKNEEEICVLSSTKVIKEAES